MATKNGKVPGTFVSHDELNALGELLTNMRDYILSHEARIELIEGWINEYTKTALDSLAEDGTPEVALAEAGESWPLDHFENEGGAVSEPADDTEEG